MRHTPGLRVMDLNKLVIPHKPDTVILTLGREKRLMVNPSLETYLKCSGIEDVYIVETSESILLYNKFVKEGKRVVALIHTTC